jgi:energy-coupling factor transporter transmembrane protein EcfT
MFAIIFLLLGILFSWFVYQAITTREILARGWGFSIRTYSQDDEPVWYWFTFTCYSICAAVALVLAVLLACKSLL